jgi:hypothetical protein
MVLTKKFLRIMEIPFLILFIAMVITLWEVGMITSWIILTSKQTIFVFKELFFPNNFSPKCSGVIIKINRASSMTILNQQSLLQLQFIILSEINSKRSKQAPSAILAELAGHPFDELRRENT